MSNPDSKPQVHGPADPACMEVFERLSEYIDGELAPVDCAHLEEHIRDCAPCVAFLESLKRCVRASHRLQAPPERPLPEDVRAKLEATWRAALQRRGA